MVAQGFSLASLKDLIRAGLVTTKTESVGRKTPVRIVRLTITDSGRKALLRANRRQNEAEPSVAFYRVRGTGREL
jgi:hypothetical protein